MRHDELRKQNEKLKAELDLIKSASRMPLDMAGIEEEFTLAGTYWVPGDNADHQWRVTLSWKQILAAMGPYLLGGVYEDELQEKLAHEAFGLTGRKGGDEILDSQVLQTVKVQLMALGLIRIQPQKGRGAFWVLTDPGKELMLESRVVKKMKRTDALPDNRKKKVD